jgi:hypothetical protein
MSDFTLAVSMIVEPRTAFERLQRRPSFWLPLILLTLGTMGLLGAYAQSVDLAWLNHQLLGDEPEMPAGFEMSRVQLMGTSILVALVGIPLMRLLEAGYYHLAAQLFSLKHEFRHWMALACWSGLPLLLPLAASAVMLAFSGDAQLLQEQLNVLSINELFLQLPPTSRWYSLLSNLTVLHPWVWWLAACGVQVWTGRSWSFALGVALLPWVLVYGVWAMVVAWA